MSLAGMVVFERILTRATATDSEDRYRCKNVQSLQSAEINRDAYVLTP